MSHYYRMSLEEIILLANKVLRVHQLTITLLILQILYSGQVTGQDNTRAIIVTSLVHEFDLPKNAMLNPFYDAEIEAMKTPMKKLIKSGRSSVTVG